MIDYTNYVTTEVEEEFVSYIESVKNGSNVEHLWDYRNPNTTNKTEVILKRRICQHKVSHAFLADSKECLERQRRTNYIPFDLLHDSNPVFDRAFELRTQLKHNEVKFNGQTYTLNDRHDAVIHPDNATFVLNFDGSHLLSDYYYYLCLDLDGPTSQEWNNSFAGWSGVIVYVTPIMKIISETNSIQAKNAEYDYIATPPSIILRPQLGDIKQENREMTIKVLAEDGMMEGWLDDHYPVDHTLLYNPDKTGRVYTNQCNIRKRRHDFIEFPIKGVNPGDHFNMDQYFKPWDESNIGDSNTMDVQALEMLDPDIRRMLYGDRLAIISPFTEVPNRPPQIGPGGRVLKEYQIVTYFASNLTYGIHYTLCAVRNKTNDATLAHNVGVNSTGKDGLPRKGFFTNEDADGYGWLDEEDADLEIDDGTADKARETKMMQVLAGMNEHVGSVLKQRYSKSGGGSAGGSASNVTYLSVPAVEYTHPLNGKHNVVGSLEQNTMMYNYGGYSGEKVFISPFEKINDVNMVAG
jgi:hypothetical protein